MEWTKKARKAKASPQLIYLLWLATMVIPRTGQPELWPKCFIKILNKFFVAAVFNDVHLIMENDTQRVTELEI